MKKRLKMKYTNWEWNIKKASKRMKKRRKDL